MGFPLIMYLSKSKVSALWPDIDKKTKKLSFNSLKSSINLSLNPKLDVVAEWKKTQEAPPPTTNKDSWWPPRNDLDIVLAIEKALQKKGAVGTMDDFLAKNFEYPCYKLSGNLIFDHKQTDRYSFRGISLNTHGFTGKLRINSNTEISMILALENIAGVDPREGEWHIWESGAMFMFGAANEDPGFPVFGLFTLETAPKDDNPKCGIVYFGAHERFNSYYRFEKEKDFKYLKYGIKDYSRSID